MMARVSSRCLAAAARARPVGVMGCRWACTVPTPSAESRDILDRVACDHRKVEDLFRAMRNRTSNRVGLLNELANSLVAHNESEELHFYPHVRGLSDQKVEGDSEVTREKAEHISGTLLLLNLLEENDVQSKSWENKLTALTIGILHHVDNEEQMVHNLAREHLSSEKRAQMGDAFVKARDQMVAQNVGSVDNVRKLVKERASMMQKVKATVLG